MDHQRIMCLLILLLFFALPAAAADYDSLISQALKYRNNGNMPAAERLLRQAYDSASDKSEAVNLLVLVLAYQEKFSVANTLLDRSLVEYPGNFDLQLTKARIQSYQGLFTQAEHTVGELLKQNPDNTEALILAGRIFFYKRQYLAARDKFLQVLASNPHSLDALIGSYDSEMYFGNVQQADIYLSRAEQLDPDNADIASRRNRHVVSGEPRHELILGLETSNFDRNTMSNWNEQYIHYQRGTVSENQMYLRFEQAKRFSLNDSYWEAGAVLRRRTPIPISISVGLGTENIFLPEQRFRVGAELKMNRGDEQFGATIGRLTYQHSRYATGKVQQTFLDMEHYLVNTNAWIIPGINFTHDENGKTTFGFRVGWHHQIASRFRYGISYADTPETENNITTDTRTFHGYLRYRLSDRIVARIDYAKNKRENSYTKDSLSLSMGYRF
jgi:YaiO family outer membrane protein